MKLTLVTTPEKVSKLLDRIDVTGDEPFGFDTEVAGPLLRGQDFTNTSYAALLGVSIAFKDEECYYLPVRHKGSNVSMWGLHQVMESVQRACISRRVWAHNAQFDHMTMLQAGYPLEGLLCSKVVAWLATGRRDHLGLKDLAKSVLGRESPPYDPAIGHQTGAQVLEYACHDALNTLQLGMHYIQAYEIPYGWLINECDFALLLGEMKLQGIAIDRPGLQKVREDGQQRLTALQAEWDKLAPFISITSAAQLQALFDDGTWQVHGRTDSGAFSTNKEAIKHQLEAGTESGRILAAIRLEYQSTNKLVTTYTDGLIEESLQWRDKKIHPDLWHFGTVTGRLSSSNPNIQNQPPSIRPYFIPDLGMEFTSADYSQVELRYFAHYCKGKLLEAFLQGKDLHDVTAEALGVTRDVGKTVNFGFLLYGGGPRKMAGLLGTDETTAGGIIANLQATYPEIETFRQNVINTVSARGPVPWCKTLAGRIRYIPELNPDQWAFNDGAGYMRTRQEVLNKYGWHTPDRSVARIIRSKGMRLVVNYLVQGGSRDLLVLGMTEYRRNIRESSYTYPSYSVVTTVHDEVLTQHPYGEGETARKLLRECLEGAGPRLGLCVPIVAEPKTGATWAKTK